MYKVKTFIMKINLRHYLSMEHTMEMERTRIIKQQQFFEAYNTPPKKATTKRRIDEDSDNYEKDYVKDNTKYDTDEAEPAQNKYTKFNNEIDDEIDDEKTDNKKVDPETINCPICYENVKISYVTTCKHNFCYSCVDTLMSRSKNQEWVCPICRKICKK